MNYRILFDYGAYEGMKFWDDTRYPTVDAAVKEALALNSGTPFLIVTVIDWQAVCPAQTIRPESTNV